MATLTQGTVSIEYPDHIDIPEEAGTLSPDALARVEKVRKGLGLACEKTAEAMQKFPDRLKVPDVSAEALANDGTAAEDIDTVIADLEALLQKLKQANVLLDARAQRQLRQVLSYVRGREQFDQGILTLVPVLIEYFAPKRARAPKKSNG